MFPNTFWPKCCNCHFRHVYYQAEVFLYLHKICPKVTEVQVTKEVISVNGAKRSFRPLFSQAVKYRLCLQDGKIVGMLSTVGSFTLTPLISSPTLYLYIKWKIPCINQQSNNYIRKLINSFLEVHILRCFQTYVLRQKLGYRLRDTRSLCLRYWSIDYGLELSKLKGTRIAVFRLL